MALLPKEKVFVVRVDLRLHEAFTRAADDRHMTVSSYLRDLMRAEVRSFEAWEKKRELAELKSAQAAFVPKVATTPYFAPVTSLVVSSGQSEKPLAKKRRLEKEAKQAEKKRRDERFLE